MFGGGFDDDEEDQLPPAAGRGAGRGRGGLFGGLLGPGHFAWAGTGSRHAHPREYDEYFKAYSVAMLPGKERDVLSYGGKIVMPPSALAKLSNLDLENPWMFQLRNPVNPAASTHSGVLEFIAEEGCVHLPYWMMKTLRLNEGDPIRVTGARLPKGKLIKIQPQQLHFLEISDPKALLEQALRNFTCLTAGDTIELSYNGMVLDFLIMDIQPVGPGICVVDADIEVDFAAPKGYVEPARPAPPSPQTMAKKLKIDLASGSPGSSRPGSAQGTAAGANTGADWESFKGLGQTLNGRKTKGKGVSVRKIIPVDVESKIIRTDKPKMVTNETLDDGRHIPGRLDVDFNNTLFFGFPVVPYRPAETEGAGSSASSSQTPAFGGGGGGQTLSGRPVRQDRPPVTQQQPSGSTTGNTTGQSQPQEAKWQGKGNTLSSSSSSRSAPPPTAARPPRSPSPDYIEVDSD